MMRGFGDCFRGGGDGGGCSGDGEIVNLDFVKVIVTRLE